MDTFNVWLLIGVIGLFLFLSIIYVVVTHDQEILDQNFINQIPCSYVKGWVQEQTELLIKSSWYEEAVKKANSLECSEKEK